MSFLTFLRGVRASLLPLVIAGFIAVLGGYFYLRAESLMAEQLRQRLQSSASVSASQFHPSDIALVLSEDDEGSPAHLRLVEQLQGIRAMIPGARYAYLVRATDNPSVVSFIADSDEKEPALPGEPYDISGMDDFALGFSHPSADHAVTYDQWGALISGYAPVRDESGMTVAVLGIDMDAEEFLGIARSIFSPVAFLLVLVAGGMLASLSFSVIQRKKLAAMHQLEADRTALLDLATHQLGMPLATFRWWLELLRERQSGANAEDHEAFDQLQLGVDRMDHIVRSLHDAANLQTGGISYHAEPVDPLEFANHVVQSMKPAFDLKHQTVEVVSSPSLPRIKIDRKLLTGVLGELLENARGYSPAQSRITVRLSRERSKVLLEVEDHGSGIPEHDMPNLFKKFSRAKNAYANKPVGNGLGLYICKNIVERGGGRISIRSTEGHGTTVSLFLPVAA